MRRVGRYILGPFLGGIEADDVDGIFLLPFEQVHDDRVKISPLDIRFAIGATVAAEVVQDDADVLIVAVRHD
jgi:hypothetical protein